MFYALGKKICAKFMTKGCPWKGVHIMLCGIEQILGHMAKEEVCRFNSPNVNANNCTISQKVYDVDGKIQPPNHKLHEKLKVLSTIFYNPTIHYLHQYCISEMHM
jgi:hypothetical protein